MAGFSAPVAELLATLGIDAAAFDAGLRKAQQDMRQGAMEMVRSIEVVKGAFAQMTQQGAGYGAAYSKNPEFQQATRDLEAYGRRLLEIARIDQEFQRNVRNRDLVYDAGARREREIDRTATQMDRGFERDRLNNLREQEAAMARVGRLKLADVETNRRLESDMERMEMSRASRIQALNNQFSGAMERRDRTFAAEQEAQAGGGGMGMAGRVIGRMGLYAGIYGVQRLAAASMDRAVDLDRMGGQTGFGIAGAQRIQSAAAQTNVPVELMTTSIVRAQRQVEEMSVKTIDAFQRMGVSAVDFATILERNPEAGIARLVQSIDRVANTPARNDLFSQFFGARGTRDVMALEKMASGTVQPDVAVTGNQVQNVEWAKGMTSRIGQGVLDMIIRQAGTTIGIARWVVGDRDQGNGNQPLAGQAGSRVAGLINAEQLKEQQKQLQETKKLLSEFGADGKSNAQLVEFEWRKLSDAFHAGRVSLEEMKEATSSYFHLMEESVARPGLEKAIGMFEAGMLGREGLLKSRNMANAFSRRRAVEEAFAKGEATPEDLERAQQEYLGSLEENGPKGYSFLSVTPKSGVRSRMLDSQGRPYFDSPQTPDTIGTIVPNLPGVLRRRQQQPSPNYVPNGGSLKTFQEGRPQSSLGSPVINVVALDDFSQQWLDRLRQQGMTTDAL